MTDDDLERRARARVGRTLSGKYLLERLIGVGGMAAVYAARHRNGARAAVKILHPDVSRDEEVRARFLDEGYAANQVGHPGAVRVTDDDVVRDDGLPGAHGAGEDVGTAYLVMELLEGESVAARARRNGGRLSEEEVLAIAEGVLEVLEAAHGRGIVHRDLKPDNLFLAKVEGDPSGRERVKVLDFGIARVAALAGRTKVGTTLGTPSYMAPEQARGQRDRIDGRSDLFALGATLFRLLTGRRIHEAPSAAEIVAMMATVPAPPLRAIWPTAGEAIAEIVDRALAFEKEARYPDAAAMRADVRAARASMPLPSRALRGSPPVSDDRDLAATDFAPRSDPTSRDLPTVAASPRAEVPKESSPMSRERPALALPKTIEHPVALPQTTIHRPTRLPIPLVLAAVVVPVVVIAFVAWSIQRMRARPSSSGASIVTEGPTEGLIEGPNEIADDVEDAKTAPRDAAPAVAAPPASAKTRRPRR
jgi:serine/threonine-protein kinase